MKKATSIAGLVLMLLTHPVEACRKMEPDIGALHSYKSVFVGELSGVRHVGYEKMRLGHADTCVADDAGMECIANVSGSPRVDLFVVATKVISGPVTGVQELSQAGCVNSDVGFKDEGIFFVQPGGNSAIVVWRSDRSEYERWLEKLGLKRSQD